MAGGSRFCLSLCHDLSTASHAHSREELEDPPGGKEVVWVFMEAPYPRLPLSDFFQTILSEKTAETVQGFQGTPMLAYSLVRTGKIFQVLEAKALETSMMYQDGIKRSKGEGETAYRRSLPHAETPPKGTIKRICNLHVRDL